MAHGRVFMRAVGESASNRVPGVHHQRLRHEKYHLHGEVNLCAVDGLALGNCEIQLRKNILQAGACKQQGEHSESRPSSQHASGNSIHRHSDKHAKTLMSTVLRSAKAEGVVPSRFTRCIPKYS